MSKFTLSRRTFMQTGTAGIATAYGAMHAFKVRENGHIGNDLVLYDPRYTKAREEASKLANLSTSYVRIFEDPISAWSHKIEPLIKKGRLTIAGYISGQALFSIAEMARDYGYQPFAVDSDAPIQAGELHHMQPVAFALKPTGINYKMET